MVKAEKQEMDPQIAQIFADFHAFNLRASAQSADSSLLMNAAEYHVAG